MQETQDIITKVEAVQALLNEKFGVRKRALGKMLRSTGRRLPRRLRARAQVLVQAQEWTAHPKLARRVDRDAVKQAHDEIAAHLRGIDVADRRKGAALSVAGSVAFNLLAVVVVFVGWMWWRGYL